MIILIKCTIQLDVMKLGQMKKLALILPMLVIMVSATSVSVTVGNIQVQTPVKTNAVKLTVATRHDSSIYQKYAAAFAKSQYGKSVGITSPDEIQFLAPTTWVC